MEEEDDMLGELYQIWHEYMHMRKRPFSLEYLAFGKSVWELGYYNFLPPLLKQIKEPNPFGRHTEFVPLMEIQFIDYLCKGPPRFYKEYFHKTIRTRSYSTFILKEASCVLCWLELFGHKIEHHPPDPIPYYKCRIRKKPRHFLKYNFVNNEVIERAPKRACTLKTLERKKDEDTFSLQLRL